MYRMRVREWVLGLTDAVITLRHTLLDVAAAHRGTIFPAHTHTQPAQPTTVAHYLLAVIEQLERDTARLFAAFSRTNRCPLGACAITGTGFPIDRARTSALLGFDGPTGNTYGSIAAVDYVLESAAATAVTAVGLGRVIQDLLLWCTAEVGYLRLPDGLVQISSVMPQKRNPVALEHARVLASKAAGQATAVLTAVHNTPFGDVVDTEDDLQPLVASLFKDATRAVALVAVTIAGAEFDVEKMRARAREGWVTLTELADTLARDHGLSFKVAHRIATRVVTDRRENPRASLSDIVARESAALAGREVRIDDDTLARILSPEHFIAIRLTFGGPAPERTAEALDAGRAHLAADEATVARRRGALVAAENALRQAAHGIGT
jgi:argininosuccinate lyase